MLLIRIFICCVVWKISSGEETVEVEIDQGTLKGLKTTTAYHGTPLYSFKGIPYAKPYIGRNKFDVAESLTSWSGVLDATKHRNACLFFCHIQKNIVGDEDCLFLNVYTSDLDKKAEKAVMVFIHGGEFYQGSGNDVLFGPDFLVEKDVVLVTMNYRLGVIGFLNPEDGSHANVGLRDQNLALKWVQKNIINFGGSPDKVTIFGQNAGAASVHYHMMSPMSQGLFKGAILQSGSALSPWAFTSNPQESIQQLASHLGLKFSDSTDIVEQLRNMDAKQLVAASREIILAQDIPRGLFVPSIETNGGQDVFLPEDPWILIKYGDIVDIPIMIGLTADEAGFMTENQAAEYQGHLCKLIPQNLNITDTELRKEISDVFDKFYFDRKPIIQNSQAFTELLSDSIFNHASLLSAMIMNSRMSSPIYEYLFDYFTSRGLLKQFYQVNQGVVHWDDLVFIFYSSYLDNIPTVGSSDEEMTNEMIEMWTNFAKEGDPSANMSVAKVKWEPMDNDGKYLDIGTPMTMKTSLFKERLELWADIYSNLLDDYAKLFN